MTNLVDYTARFLNTAEALDYTPDELDDLTHRKVEAVEFDGDALARVVRARRESARANFQPDPYNRSDVDDAASEFLWGSLVLRGTTANRRMAAVGHVLRDHGMPDRFIVRDLGGGQRHEGIY